MTMSVQQQYPQMAPPPPFLSSEEVALLKRTMLKTFPEDEQESFIRTCQRTKLDPFTKQIYATRRYNKVRDENNNFKKVPTLVAVTGIMGLTAIAFRTGHYRGAKVHWAGKDAVWKDEWLEEEYPEAARALIFREGLKEPEIGVARWFSYVGQQWNQDKKQWEITEFWSKMPDYMLAKCARAQGLRFAFPDQLSDVYIREELESNITEAETETATIPSDEQKILDNRKREAEIQASGRFQVVEQTLPETQPTPEEVIEPALERDKIPPKTAPPTAPPPPPAAKPDEIDMSSPSTDIKDAPPPWREHVVEGVQHVKFHGRKIGELNGAELAIIEQQWLPAIREQWEDATDAQRADADAFERAIAFHKMQKMV